MNQRGERFLTVREFIRHASRLKVKHVTNRELEFYEQNCLLLPVARTRMPTEYAVILAQEPRRSPARLKPPAEWARLIQSYRDGMHVFDRERDNPFLQIPDCATFRPWDTDAVALLLADGREILRKTVERYYAAWQVHIVESLRRLCFYQRAQFLSPLPESHFLRERYRLPENTENIRSLNGMAVGYNALTLFSVARKIARQEAYYAKLKGQSASQTTGQEMHDLLTRRAHRAGITSGVDEPGLYNFVDKLTRMIEDYRADERLALAEDAEQDLWTTSEFAYYAYGHYWDGFLAAAETYGGQHLADRLRRLDAVEATKLEALDNLKSILQDETIVVEAVDQANTPAEIVEFCLTHDLFEVLTGIHNYSYSLSEQRRDGYPGYLHRRIRPLALAVEQLARGILETADKTHHGRSLTRLIEIIGADSKWLQDFKSLCSQGQTSDKKGDLLQKALSMARSIETMDANEGGKIARTLVCAVQVRNIVSHRHKFLSRQESLTLGGICAEAVVLVWLLAKQEGLV